MHEPSVN